MDANNFNARPPAGPNLNFARFNTGNITNLNLADLPLGINARHISGGVVVLPSVQMLFQAVNKIVWLSRCDEEVKQTINNLSIDQVNDWIKEVQVLTSARVSEGQNQTLDVSFNDFLGNVQIVQSTGDGGKPVITVTSDQVVEAVKDFGTAGVRFDILEKICASDNIPFKKVRDQPARQILMVKCPVEIQGVSIQALQTSLGQTLQLMESRRDALDQQPVECNQQ